MAAAREHPCQPHPAPLPDGRPARAAPSTRSSRPARADRRAAHQRRGHGPPDAAPAAAHAWRPQGSSISRRGGVDHELRSARRAASVAWRAAVPRGQQHGRAHVRRRALVGRFRGRRHVAGHVATDMGSAGGRKAPLTPLESIRGMLGVLSGLGPDATASSCSMMAPSSVVSSKTACAPALGFERKRRGNFRP